MTFPVWPPGRCRLRNRVCYVVLDNEERRIAVLKDNLRRKRIINYIVREAVGNWVIGHTADSSS